MQGHKGNFVMNEEKRLFKSSTISLKETALFRKQVPVWKAHFSHCSEKPDSNTNLKLMQQGSQ